jgi:hypothetical protein
MPPSSKSEKKLIEATSAIQHSDGAPFRCGIKNVKKMIEGTFSCAITIHHQIM